MAYDQLCASWLKQTGKTGDAVVESMTVEDEVRELFESWHLSVYWYLCSVLGDQAEAEDLTQEAFLRLYKELRSGVRIHNPRAWVFRVAHNLAVPIQLRPHHSNVDDLVGGNQLELESHENAETQMLAVEQEGYDRRRLTHLLDSLSARERQTIELRLQGLCFREIAEAMGISLSTVQTLLTRAMQKAAKSRVARSQQS